ncbi:MAG TPA: PfkB family carbohydrate kinase, partial [Actinomycetota bacterium]|nr:PfkB family carbohydrate kinase [Actinomycetota bacterium]
ARVLVATSRILGALTGVRLDALVGSARDPVERFDPGSLEPRPRVEVLTEGAHGGRYWTDGGEQGRFGAGPTPSDLLDTYGAGDSFAAGLTYALSRGDAVTEALRFAARCGAEALGRRGAGTLRPASGRDQPGR